MNRNVEDIQITLRLMPKKIFSILFNMKL